jgi:beta-glucosidase
VAEESRALGIAWNLDPIADVQINPENPIINTRCFGEETKVHKTMIRDGMCQFSVGIWSK